MDQAELARWLQTRFTDAAAKAEWAQLLEAGYDRLLDQRLERVLPPGEVQAFLDARLTSASLAEVVRPLVRAALIPAVKEMRADHEKLGRWVPESARKEILEVVSKRGLVHRAWIESLFREEAVEAILTDTLYRAIRDFSTIIPRLIQNLSPLGRLGKIGGGIGTRVIEEIEKRIEPEIRRFLDKGTRRALEQAARFTIEHLDDPASLALRRNTVAFVLDQEVAFHAHPLSDDLLTRVEAIVDQIARFVAERDESKARVKDAVSKIAARYGARPIREVLEEIGVTERPPFGAWAELTWPMVVTSLIGWETHGWFQRLAGELLELLQPGVTKS